MRHYEVWCDGQLSGSAASLALALSFAHHAAAASEDGSADVYQGRHYTARVCVPDESIAALAASLED